MFCHGSKTIKVKNNSGRWILSQEHFIGHACYATSKHHVNKYLILKQTARHNHALNKLLLLLLLLLKYVISQLLPIKTLKFLVGLSNASETTSSINSSVLRNLSSVKI